MPRCHPDAAGDVFVGGKLSKIGPKEQQRRALRERGKVPDATPEEIARLLKQRDKRRVKARVYQRGYYKKHREQILQQRKERAARNT